MYFQLIQIFTCSIITGFLNLHIDLSVLGGWFCGGRTPIYILWLFSVVLSLGELCTHFIHSLCAVSFWFCWSFWRFLSAFYKITLSNLNTARRRARRLRARARRKLVFVSPRLDQFRTVYSGSESRKCSASITARIHIFFISLARQWSQIARERIRIIIPGDALVAGSTKNGP